jgi:hypothetical protein
MKKNSSHTLVLLSILATGCGNKTLTTIEVPYLIKKGWVPPTARAMRTGAGCSQNELPWCPPGTIENISYCLGMSWTTKCRIPDSKCTKTRPGTLSANYRVYCLQDVYGHIKWGFLSAYEITWAR